MINPLIFLIFIAGIFLLGFLGNLFFKKTKVSDILILILLGLLIGPIFNIIPESIIFTLRNYTTIFAAVALIVLIFDGGLYLNFIKLLQKLKMLFYLLY